MELGFFLEALIPFWNSVTALVMYFGYLAVAGFVLPGKVVPGVILQDGSRLHYRCNGLLSLLLLVVLLGIGAKVDVISPTVISERGVELLSTTFAFSCLVLNLGDTGALCCWVQFKTPGFFPKTSHHRKPSTWLVVRDTAESSVFGNYFFFVRAGMMGWLFINLSILAKCILEDGLSHSMILCQVFCAIYILDYFLYEEYMTSTMAMVSTLGARWDIIAERLGFMLVFGDLVWIPFTFSIQGWWLLANKVELTAAAVIANCLVFLLGYVVFRGANKQKHVFKKNPKATIWGRPPKVIGGKLLASGYWGIARHCNYLGDFLLALSFSLPCGLSSPVPYFYPIYLLILLIWRERRDEARCAEKYKEMWAEYRRLVPWRKEPYLY